MATRSPRRPTPEQRDARRREQLEQLRQATSALLTSEGWQRWLRTRSRFHRYSLRNTLLIAFQCPHATHVAGFRRWLELGRCVRKGEKAIRIFAPGPLPPPRLRADRRRRNAGSSSSASSSQPSSTSRRPSRCLASSRPRSIRPASRSAATATPICSPRSNSTPHHSASASATSRSTGRAGYCSAREARIVIDSELPANGKVATLVHELAHAHGIDYERFSRAEAELIVESVACIVCGSVGLDTSSESVPYLAGWNPDQAVERIELLAGTIDQIARAIERALDPDDNRTDTPAAVTPVVGPDRSQSRRELDSGQL